MLTGRYLKYLFLFEHDFKVSILVRTFLQSNNKYFSKERYNTHAKSCNSILYT